MIFVDRENINDGFVLFPHSLISLFLKSSSFVVPCFRLCFRPIYSAVYCYIVRTLEVCVCCANVFLLTLGTSSVSQFVFFFFTSFNTISLSLPLPISHYLNICLINNRGARISGRGYLLCKGVRDSGIPRIKLRSSGAHHVDGLAERTRDRYTRSSKYIIKYIIQIFLYPRLKNLLRHNLSFPPSQKARASTAQKAARLVLCVIRPPIKFLILSLYNINLSVLPREITLSLFSSPFSLSFSLPYILQ